MVLFVNGQFLIFYLSKKKRFDNHCCQTALHDDFYFLGENQYARFTISRLTCVRWPCVVILMK
jgi:hypothetical protein